MSGSNVFYFFLKNKMINKVIAGRFQIKSKLGGGSFGDIYVADDLLTLKEVAVKIDTAKDKTYQLTSESKIYSIFEGQTNIPEMYWYGQFGRSNVLAMELLGKSVQDLFVECNRRFSLKTVLMLAEQMISVVEYIHTRHFIHRDIKPNNFVFGNTNSKKENQIYLIDFGLSRKYRDPKTLEHEQFCCYQELSGTARYASINALKGAEQSRRDDMESLGYMFVYFLKGYLPWMGITENDATNKNAAILHKKQSIKIDELCEGLPVEFAQYLKFVRKLKFAEQPNYSEYRQLFRNLFIKQGYVYDYHYDWNDLVINSSSTIQSKIRTLRNAKSTNNLPLIESRASSNINENDNTMNNNNNIISSKRIPIIHNKRLVPNFDSMKKNQNTTAKPKQARRNQNQQQSPQFVSTISKSHSRGIIQPSIH